MIKHTKGNPKHHDCALANCFCSNCGHSYQEHCFVAESTECKFEDGCEEYVYRHGLLHDDISPLREAVLSAVQKQTQWKRRKHGESWVREIAGGFITVVVWRPIAVGHGTRLWQIYINGILLMAEPSANQAQIYRLNLKPTPKPKTMPTCCS